MLQEYRSDHLPPRFRHKSTTAWARLPHTGLKLSFQASIMHHALLVDDIRTRDHVWFIRSLYLLVSPIQLAPSLNDQLITHRCIPYEHDSIKFHPTDKQPIRLCLLCHSINVIYSFLAQWRNQLHNGTRAADQFNHNHYLSIICKRIFLYNYVCALSINQLMTNNLCSHLGTIWN